MEVNIFKCFSYKEFLLKIFDSDSLEKGQRSKLATHLGCQTGLISQVMNGERHFSLEQLIEIANFYELKGDEKDFFMLLGQFEKAANPSLKKYYEEKIEKMRLGRQRLPSATSRTVSEIEFGLYHSKWYNHALHVLLEAHPEGNRDVLAQILRITPKKVDEALEFLIQIGAAKKVNQKYQVIEINNSASRNSPWVDGIHQDFRLEAIKSLDLRSLEDSHYSRFFLANSKKMALIQEELADFMKKLNQLIERVEPEDKELPKQLGALCLDSFSYQNV